MYKDRNNSLLKSQNYHAKRFDPDFGGRHSNVLTNEYHIAVFRWQDKHKRIMPKKLREKYYDKIVFSKITD